MTVGTTPAPPQRHRGTTAYTTAMSWLGHDIRGAGVLATARLHLHIQQALTTVLPGPLAAACRVLAVSQQRLYLGVPTAAYAAKLRQLGATMGRGLSERGFHIAAVEVRVQASLQRLGSTPPRAHKEAIPLDERALLSFESLHRNLKPGLLADAVAKLLAHHRE